MSAHRPSAEPKRILLADDDEHVLQNLKEMLEPYYLVDVAMSASKVQRLYQQNSYYYLILDVTFDQGVGGLEIASRIREHDGEVGIIICSGVNYSDDVRQYVAEMNAQFIQKPLTLDILLEKLGRES